MKTWKKGAILGFLFIPVWFSFGSLIIPIAALIPSETFRGMMDALFMLTVVPNAFIQQKLGITTINPILASIPLWILIGAFAGYLVDKWKNRNQVK